MSGTDDAVLPSGGGRVLMTSTVVSAAAGAVVLAWGTHDARLLRLGLVAALWAALLGAFAVARMRRESSSCADRVDQLRTVYQLELEREVTARREYTLTVERELREQAELSQRREIAELHAELAAMRVNLEQLVGGRSDDSDKRTPVAATSGLSGPELRFGPGCPPTPTWGSAPSPAGRGVANGGAANGRGRHDVPSREWSGSNGNGQRANGSHVNGSHVNGSHVNSADAGQAPDGRPMASQRTVRDLLAAHRADSAFPVQSQPRDQLAGQWRPAAYVRTTQAREAMMGKREDKTDQDRQDPPHKPQGTRTQQPDPGKPDGRHGKPDRQDGT